VAWSREAGSRLKSTLNGIESVERVQQLQARFSHLIAGFGKLLHVNDRKFDPVDSDSGLIGHFELNR
jgi:hypothetical protein